MTDKHTPGSWDVNPHDMRHDSWPVFSEDRYRVAEIPNVNRSPANAANARLIAAALAEPTCKQDLQVAEQEAEPVAWMYRSKTSDSDKWYSRSRWPDPERYEEVPLYSHPPLREWRGLTDEEIVALIPDNDFWNYEVSLEEAGDFARAIEQSLRAKNGG